MFFALPLFNNLYDGEALDGIFTPKSLYSGFESNARGIGNTYVMMYTHEPSHHLNIPFNDGNSTGYLDDGLDIADSTGEILPVALSEINSNTSSENYTIPAFGVTFAKQNQMYFKAINVSMDNPRETDVSIANRFILAGNETGGQTRSMPSTVGQDLYSIYSNRSYDCSVDMMGCMNIMPLMYFQLNNVPMFKGAYRIVGVKHHIENGSMTTSFSGTRISKNAINFNDNVIDIESLMEQMTKSEIEDGYGEGLNSIGYGGVFNSTTQEIENITPIGTAVPLETVGNVSDVPKFDVVRAINALKGRVEVRSGVVVVPYNNYSSKSGCATAVKVAVNEGFRESPEYYYKVWISGYNGYECYAILNKLKFKAIRRFHGSNAPVREALDWGRSKEVAPGDVAVMTYAGKKYGHVCFFCGDTWVSDYNQRGNVWVYGEGHEIVDIIIFRYAGQRIMPDYFKNISIINKDSQHISIKDENVNDAVSLETMRNDGWSRTYIISSTKENIFGNVKDIANSVSVSIYGEDNDGNKTMLNGLISKQADNTFKIFVSSSNENVRKAGGTIYIDVDSK